MNLKEKFFTRAGFLLWVWVGCAPFFSLPVRAVPPHDEKVIYIIAGDLRMPDHSSMPNFLIRRSLYYRMRNWMPGDDIYYGDGFLVPSSDGRIEKIGFKDVEAAFSKMREKGYRIRIVKKVEAKKLLEILESDQTVAVFYAGHSSLSGLASDPETLKEHLYLSVYEKGRITPLTADVIAKSKQKLGHEFKPGKSLKLFFTGSCSASYCEARLRKDLQLPESMQFLAAGGTETVTRKRIALFFKKTIQPWADALPNLKKTGTSSNLNCFGEALPAP